MECRRRCKREFSGPHLIVGFLVLVFWHNGVGAPVYSAMNEQANLTADISWMPEEPRQGDVVILSVVLDEGVRVREGRFQSKPLCFFSSPGEPRRLHALLGVDASKKPGDYEVNVILESGTDSRVSVPQTVHIKILRETFEEEHLTLPDSMVNLSKESLERVKRDQMAIAALWSKITPKRLWRGAFIAPLEGKPGSPFGLRRWINEEPRNFHTGMDVKAPEGTPVLASNGGRIALTGDFFFGGNSVFIDHGYGLYTMYFHLSRIKVKKGERVERGTVIGWVGKTGRATGPHLHWGVRLDGERVDPEALLRCTKRLSSNDR